MKTSNVIGVAAAAALLTALELGLAATLLGTRVTVGAEYAQIDQPYEGFAATASTLEPIVVVAAASD